MLRDEKGIIEVKTSDTSILQKIMSDPNLVTNVVKSVITALLKSFDFSKNPMLRGVLTSALSNPKGIADSITTNKEALATLTNLRSVYDRNLAFIANLEDTTGSKTLDSYILWEAVDASSDNFTDRLLDYVYAAVGLQQLSKSVNYTVYDLYDLQAYKYQEE